MIISDGKLFQSQGAAAANVLSPKELCVRPTDDPCSNVSRTQIVADQHVLADYRITRVDVKYICIRSSCAI